MFASPSYAALREIISAHCTKWQVEYLEASLYSNEVAQGKADHAKTQAARFNTTLDVLDWIQEKGEEWFRINLEQRR